MGTDWIITGGINSLWPGRFQWNCRWVLFKPVTMIDGWDILCETSLRRMSLDLTDDKSTLVQVMALCRQAASHYLSQCWPRSLSTYDVTRPQWVNSLWPSDALWQQTAGSSLAQVMACSLMALSHYLNRCWFLINKILWHSPESNSIERALSTILYQKFGNYTFQITPISPNGQKVKGWQPLLPPVIIM